MAELNTCIGLLVGSELASKSHPGTQATSSDVAQGPGCPSYSGGGKEPSKPIHSTTPASPLDLTSLAAAIPGPAPALASAWTLVAPKQRSVKKKIKPRKDRRTGTRQTDEQLTDRQTDKKPTDSNNSDRQTLTVGNGGGKRKDPDCPSASMGGSVGGSTGGDEGRKDLVDAATPSCSTNERDNGQRPVTDRDPNASGVSSTYTTGAGQTVVKDRRNGWRSHRPQREPNPDAGRNGPQWNNHRSTPKPNNNNDTSNT